MSRSRDLENHLDELGDRARRHASEAGDAARGWIARGRSAAARFDGDGYRRRLARAAEDLADETSYRYRRVKRHVSRHPVATAAIVTGVAVGVFMLVRQVLRNRDED